MNRRAFVTGLGAVLAASLAAEAQQTGTVYRIGYLTVPGRESAHSVADTFATHALGLHQQVVEIRGPEEFEDAFATLARRADAIFVPADSMFYQYRMSLAQLAAKTRLPAMWGLREQAEAGGLMAYATDLHDLGRRGAIFVDKILKGAKPSDIPVEQPSKFELVINLKTAKTLNLTISPSLLMRADQVIE